MNEVLMCSGCGATVEHDETAGGGHVVQGSVPDLCGPVEEANPAVCRHCSTTYHVPARLVPQEDIKGSTVEVRAVPDESTEQHFDLLRYPIVHRCAEGEPIESSHAG